MRIATESPRMRLEIQPTSDEIYDMGPIDMNSSDHGSTCNFVANSTCKIDDRVLFLVTMDLHRVLCFKPYINQFLGPRHIFQ